MTALVTLAQAKTHLRIEHDDDDADIALKADQATAVILDYIKYPEGWEAWDETTVPLHIQAAILIMLSKLYDDRNAGADDNPNVAMGYLPPSVTALLHRSRDPAIA